MERKKLRLTNYDYSGAGTYFLTLCAREKMPLFGRIGVGGGVLDAPETKLSPYGEIVLRQMEEMMRIYDDLSLLHAVVMPNHVHLLLRAAGPSGTSAPTRANQRIPTFVSTFKRMSNRRSGVQLWRRGY